MSFPKVTIAIPVYNGSNYLAEAIESALAQDYENTEIIVVNDGSDDNGATESIAHRYLSSISYIAQANSGVGGAMNTALRAMTGDVFTWLSHDDVYLPHKTSAQVAYHRRLRKPDAILFSNYHRIDAAGAVTHTSRYSIREFMDIPMLPLLQGAINGCTLYIPAHILREFGPFNERLRFAQDYDLWNKVLAKYDFLLQPDVLVKYRVHAGQDTHKPGFVAEGNDLWTRMLDSRSPAARTQMAGSSKRFFASRAAFLAKTQFKEAASHAAARADSAARETLVSVVLPYADVESEVLLGAVRSVLVQTHPEVQLILVDHGTAQGGPVTDAIGPDPRVVLVRAGQASLNEARNRGLLAAEGEYIAILGPRDRFAPDKISRQVESMQERGTVMSHTSYEVFRPEAPAEPGIVSVGALKGQVYPRILAECPIATSTVMLHSSLVGAGFRFDPSHAEADGLSWMWIARRHEIDALDDALTTIEWSDRNGALTRAEQARRAAWIFEELRCDLSHSSHRAEISALERTARGLALSAAEDERSRSWQADLAPETFLNGLPLSAVFHAIGEGLAGLPERPRAS